MSEKKWRWCKDRGFQNEQGFKAKLVGELRIPILECSSDLHPEKKQRFVMPVDKFTSRVHDYGFIGRAHGKQVVHDRWSLGRVGRERVLELAARQLSKASKEIVTWIKELLAKVKDR